ncbi:MAG: nucleotide kinase domain-containing protein [bacterium]
MEIPSNLVKLYRHWEKHSTYPISFSSTNNVNPETIKDIELFITERMNIWQRKQEKQKPPYTNDPILQKYKFCNMYRELDRQTIEIHTFLNKIRDDFSLWLLNIAFFRFVCRPNTIKRVDRLSFEKKDNNQVYEKLLQLKSPKYGDAYVFPISVIQNSKYNTREKFLCSYLPSVIPTISKLIASFQNKTVLESLDIILPEFGYNFRFHWTEILIDIAYQFPEKIDLFKDFYVGPGAPPTLKKLSKRENVLNDLVRVKLEGFPYLTYKGSPIYLSAENWEGIACEFRKYTNLKSGNGRKRLYYNN